MPRLRCLHSFFSAGVNTVERRSSTCFLASFCFFALLFDIVDDEACTGTAVGASTAMDGSVAEIRTSVCL